MFSSDRSFVLYSYSFSHGLLLLRSGKDRSNKTRVDVLFRDVRAMEIRSWFTGLEISEEPAQILREFASDPRPLLEEGNKVYRLKGVGWTGCIMAGIVRTLEDEGEFFAESPLIGKDVRKLKIDSPNH